MRIEGVFLYYDKENRNGRIYTKQCAEDIVEQFKKMGDGTCLGEPMQNDLEIPQIRLSQVSHRINDVWIDEDTKTVKGSIEILDGTPRGVMLKEAINTCGIENFSVASRGTGTVNEVGEVEDYELISFDIVPMEKSSTKGPIQITDL